MRLTDDNPAIKRSLLENCERTGSGLLAQIKPHQVQVFWCGDTASTSQAHPDRVGG
jgi:hypothetical protein